LPEKPSGKQNRPGTRPACKNEMLNGGYFFGAGAFVAGGEDMSPLSLQATKNVALTNARNRYVISFFMDQV
jgi:hypothetical protein